MIYIQIHTPNPNIPCRPGWCLEYVDNSFQVPHTFIDARSAWLASASKHQDRNFPQGMWLPVWFMTAIDPHWHVALLAPDSSVYSASDPNTSIPHHHASIDALIQYYAKADQLTYLGWTEDVGGTLVVKENTMSALDIGAARILAYHVGGRNGYDGRSNALSGSSDPDLMANHVGHDAGQEIWGWYNSTEGQNYRGVILPTVYSERDQAKTQVASQATTITQLQTQVKDLQTQLALQSQDTVNLNAFGQSLKWLINRLGLK